MASVLALSWSASRFLSSGTGSLRRAFTASASGKSGADGRHACKSYAEGTRPDEPAVAHVISDITGLTGLAILDAILGGERDPFTLAGLRHDRIKASEEVIAKSLVGDYRSEHLFTLRQSLRAYRSYQQLIDECDREIRAALDKFQPPVTMSGPDAYVRPPEFRKTRAASADAGLRTELKRVFGVDLTKIPGIRTGIAQMLFGEIGPDFTKFRSASAFASWMGLCPDNDISGGKVLWVGTRKVKCRAATSLRS